MKPGVSRETNGAACQVRWWVTLPRELLPGGCCVASHAPEFSACAERCDNHYYIRLGVGGGVVTVKVFEVFSQARIFKVFSEVGVWVQQRFVEQKLEAPTCVLLVRRLGWVSWRRAPT